MTLRAPTAPLPGLVLGIHVFELVKACEDIDLGGRIKPGHGVGVGGWHAPRGVAWPRLRLMMAAREVMFG